MNSFIFVVTTFLGKIPSIALEALVSYEFINANEGSIKLIITIVALILLWLTIKKITVKGKLSKDDFFLI